MSQPDGLPPGTIVYGPDATCSLANCPAEWSVYGYRPTLAGNATILALFAIPMFIQIALGIRHRTWFFMISMILGSVAEIVGYSGRLILYNNPFSFDGFLIQIICITLAPVYYSAAIYVTLSQIVTYLDPGLSRIPPKLYYWIFIPCDIVSLVLQASGGGLSSSSSGISQPAIDVSIAGLAFQVVTLAAFTCLAAVYGIRYWRRSHSEKRETLPPRFKLFVTFLSIAVVALFIRCCYRIFELSGGYTGPNIRDEGLFIALESVMVLIACWSLIIAHPGLVFSSRSTNHPIDPA